MAYKKHVFPETSRSATLLKICGTCLFSPFNLTVQNEEFLTEMARHHGCNNMRLWAETGIVKNFGGAKLNHAKTRAGRLIRGNATFCKVAKAQVTWADPACFLWRPKT